MFDFFLLAPLQSMVSIFYFNSPMGFCLGEVDHSSWTSELNIHHGKLAWLAGKPNHEWRCISYQKFSDFRACHVSCGGRGVRSFWRDSPSKLHFGRSCGYVTWKNWSFYEKLAVKLAVFSQGRGCSCDRHCTSCAKKLHFTRYSDCHTLEISGAGDQAEN